MQLGSANKWIEQLQSGKYLEGAGQLRYENYYCVYGVLADFLDPQGWKIDSLHGYSWHNEVFFIKNTALLNKAKMKNELLRELTEVNDNYGFFGAIQFIKKYYIQL